MRSKSVLVLVGRIHIWRRGATVVSSQMDEQDFIWPSGFVEEILTLLDRIEIEGDASLAGQRHDLAEKHGFKVVRGEFISGRIN